MSKEKVIMTRGENKVSVSKEEYERHKEFYHDQFMPDKVEVKKNSSMMDGLFNFGGNKKSKVQKIS